VTGQQSPLKKPLFPKAFVKAFGKSPSPGLKFYVSDGQMVLPI
jgi:hypothetical protein